MARRSIRRRTAHVLAALLLVASAMPIAAADPSPPAPPLRSAPNPRNIDSGPSPEGGASPGAPAAAFAPIGGGAFINNGVIELGVNPQGHLNVDGGPPSAGEGQTEVGLRWLFLNTDATSPGCLCEGWGAADATTRVSGWANGDWGIAPNLRVVSFQADEIAADSVVEILDPQSRPTLRVRHLYMPVPDNPFLYQALVTIENVSDNPIDARYRRVMDWDVEPTAFNEYVTLAGDSTAEPWLAQMTNDGFANPDPLSPATDLGVRGSTQDYPFPDPAFDHGALFDLNFGTIEKGRFVAFSIYYGVAGNESDARAALERVGVSVYSLGQTSTGQATGLPNTFMFGFGRPITCDQENFALAESRAEAGTRPGLSEVIVRYDPRTLVDPRLGTWEQAAPAVADAIRVQAERALDRYRAFGFDVSPSVTIEITCDLFFALPIDQLRADPATEGLVEADNKIKLRTSKMVDGFRAAVLAWDPAAGPFVPPAGYWQQLVDHEVFHAVQVHEKPIHLQALFDFAAGDGTRIESTAMGAQDLDPEWDDKTAAQGSDYASRSGSLLTFRTVGDLAAKSAIDATEGGFGAPYEAGLIFQYWAERFEPFVVPDLEQRYATFLRRLIVAPGVRTDAMRWALSGRDAYSALREFLIAAYVRDVPNVAAFVPRYTFRDEVTGTSGGPLLTQLDPLRVEQPFKGDLGVGPLLFGAETLASGQGAVYEVALPAGTEQVRVDFTPPPGEPRTPVRLAFLRIDLGAGDIMVNARIDPFLMTDGPFPGDTFQGFVPVAGAERLAIVVVASQTDAKYDLAIQLANPDGVQILQPAPGATIQIQPGVAARVGIEVSPTVAGIVPTGLGPGAFSVTVGGQPAIVQTARPKGDRYLLTILVPAGLPVGSHDIVIQYGSRSATRLGGITVASTAPAPRREISAADSLGILAQSATGSAIATVSGGTASAAFSLAWQGSDFDLTLRSPSGRVITETTVAEDVTVTQGAATVEILVRTPEAGSWTLEAFGRVVPAGGEEVSYQVTEPNVPVSSELILPAGGSAGAPIDIGLALGGLDGGLLDAQVIARVSDPSGTVRRYPMTDVGTRNDGVGGDGIYGAAAWSTPLAGAYQVRVEASGVDASGNAYSRVWRAQVTLGAKIDTDGDGLANDAEIRWHLNPSDPTDAAVDLDGDGLTWLQEANASTDPFLPDTDGGRELDRTEVAAGRDPLDPGDDIAIPEAVVIAQPEDGRLVSLFVHTEGGVGTVVIDRVGPGGTVRVGTFPSSDTPITDGPLLAGTYRYRATVVLAGGAEGVPFEVGPIDVADDAVAPSAALVLNEGAWQTADRDVVARFVDLTESVASMRLALSEADLATMAWEPFDPIVDVRLAAVLGPQRVYAQVRDAAGRESVIFSAVIDLTVVDDTPPVTSAGPLPAATPSPDISVPFISSDVGTGVVAVELWQRERAASADPWGPWHFVRSSDTSPIQVALASDGDYEFFTIGVDNAGNREVPPAVADAFTTVDRTAATSVAGPLSASYSTASLEVPYTASDVLSGVASVELWSRYRATSVDPWGAWTLGPGGTSSPITYTFGADGLYEFYTLAIDVAGNREEAPAAPDAATEKLPSGGWSSGVLVNAADTLDQIQPALTLGAGDTAYAAWVHDWFGLVDIYFSQRDPSTGSWATQERVNDVTTDDQFEPDIAVDGSGNVYVIWSDDRISSSDRDIYFSKRSVSTGLWSTNVRVNDDARRQTSLQQAPSIAMSSAGDLIAVWHDMRANKEHIYAARLPAGSSTWSPNMRVTSVSSRKQRPDVAIGPDGTAYAVWLEPAVGDADIWLSTLAPGGTTWSAQVKISDDPGTAYQGEPHIGVDGAGNVTVVWQDWRTNPFQLRARLRPAGGSWEPSIVVAADGANSPSLSVRADGRAFVAWYDGLNSFQPNVWGSEYDPVRGFWSAPLRISDPVPTDTDSAPAAAIGTSAIMVLTHGRHDNACSCVDYDIFAKIKRLAGS